MRFSIIVPVYNTLKYLEQCVNSVLTQVYSDYQLILVDDGSTDGSEVLCDRLTEEHQCIRVIHQTNAGLGAARNTGIAEAEGDWILFLDSDDFYPQDDFLYRLATAAPADVICFNYARYTNSLATPLISYTGTLPIDIGDRKKTLVQYGAYTSSACLKAVRRELICREALTFEQGVLSEDIEWSAKLLCVAQTIDFVPELCYAYRVRLGSITRTVSQKHVQDLCSIVERLAEQNVESLQHAEQQAYQSYVAFQYATLMISVQLCVPEASSELRERVRSLHGLLEHDLCAQVKLIRRVSGVVGYQAAGWLLKIYFLAFRR